MSPFSLRKKSDTSSLSTSAPASGLASSQVTQQSQFRTDSQSHLQSPQEKQQSQPVGPWSAHIPPSGQWPSPFPRRRHAISTTATAAGELFLFGGISNDRICSDLYMISIRDFSPTLLQTSGDVPSPRYGHSVMLTSAILLVWGGTSDEDAQGSDDSFYLLDLVSREWTRVVVNGPGPGGRYYHTMTLIGSNLFVFGGRSSKGPLNDIWVIDLDRLKSNSFWESYEPAPGNDKPLPRFAHVSVTTGDRIFIFGGGDDSHDFNDTWSFDISTQRWTELQCTGSIPSPRGGHAAVLIDNVMYVYGGGNFDGTYLGDLTAFNLTTQRWIAFQGIGQSPSGRFGHAMACDGTRVFVLGGKLSPGVQADETELIHVLDTNYLDYPEPDFDVISPTKKTMLVQKPSASSPTRGLPRRSSSPLTDAHAAHHTSPFQKLIPEQPTSLQITREQNPSLNGLPSRPTGVSGRPRHVPEEDDDGEGSTEHHAKPVAPDLPSGKEIAQLKYGRLIELERQQLAMRAAQTERDHRIGQLTDELARKNALLARSAEEKKRAGLELRNLQAKLEKSLLSRDQAKANAAGAKKRAGLEQRELQTKLDGLLQSRDQALEQAQSTLQNATFRAAEANERWQRELAEVHAKLEARESELAAVRLRLTDAEDGWAQSKAEADTLRAQAVTGHVNTEERVIHRLMERVRAMESEVLSLRGNEKSIEDMECRNEG